MTRPERQETDGMAAIREILMYSNCIVPMLCALRFTDCLWTVVFISRLYTSEEHIQYSTSLLLWHQHILVLWCPEWIYVTVPWCWRIILFWTWLSYTTIRTESSSLTVTSRHILWLWNSLKSSRDIQPMESRFIWDHDQLNYSKSSYHPKKESQCFAHGI